MEGPCSYLREHHDLAENTVLQASLLEILLPFQNRASNTC